MAEKTKDDPTTPRYIWWMLMAVVVLVYLSGLNLPFVGPDEPRYAEVAREMFVRGDWITPTLGGHNWFEKPVLLYWLEMIGFAVFGVHEYAARLGPAFCGLGTVAGLWFLGRTAAGENKEEREFPMLLALIAASTLGIIVFSRAASFDIVLTFSVTASLVSFFAFDRQAAGHRSYLPLVLFYVFSGVALLAKGLIGLIFPLAIVGVYFLLSRKRPDRWVWFSTIWGTVIALAVASVWYAPMMVRHGYGFIDEFIIQQQFARFISNKYQHPQPFYFYLWVLPLMTLPWLPVFLVSIWSTIRGLFGRSITEDIERSGHVAADLPVLASHVRSATEDTERSGHVVADLPVSYQSSRQDADVPVRDRSGRQDAGVPVRHSSSSAFALAWLVVPLVFFSFSGSKLPGYVLPAVPGAILLAAIYIYPRFRRTRRWRIGIFALGGTTLAAVFLLTMFASELFRDSLSVGPLIKTASERGFSSNRVLTLHSISHSAEFYAAGRLMHKEDGDQLRLEGITEIVDQIKAVNGETVLVLVPVEYLSQLTDFGALNTDVLDRNSEIAIAAVSIR
jgi:4-amino-4-deoxy-L-arabinose transferase-like glycosyltransferase